MENTCNSQPKASTRPIRRSCFCCNRWHHLHIPFGGYDKNGLRNALWKLSRTKEGSFAWSNLSFIKHQCKRESPSPRDCHTGWDFEGKLYTFGGRGYLRWTDVEGYLNDHGKFTHDGPIRNNQLLYYDPDAQTWTNPQSFGAVPSPRSGHCSTISREKVWMFGGYDEYSNCSNDLFELNMSSLTWTQIPTGWPKPKARSMCTLTATKEHQLVLHGGLDAYRSTQFHDTWIMDLTTHSWRFYSQGKGHTRNSHTATLGPYSNVIIIGGAKDLYDGYERYDHIFCVMLEPKSLQKLALHTVHKHKDELPLICLPKKLTTYLGMAYLGSRETQDVSSIS